MEGGPHLGGSTWRDMRYAWSGQATHPPTVMCLDTPRYGQSVVGTHPTGMDSCLISLTLKLKYENTQLLRSYFL